MKRLREENLNTIDWWENHYKEANDANRVIGDGNKYNAVNKYIPDGKLIDVACGTGVYGWWLKHNRPNIEYTGIDFSEHSLRKAQENRPDGKFVRLDMSSGISLPYLINSANSVAIFDFLEHLENPFSLVADVRQLLKEDGILAVIIPAENVKQDDDINTHIWNIGREDFRKILSCVGKVIIIDDFVNNAGWKETFGIAQKGKYGG